MRNNYIIIRQRAIMGQDSFTYGNWRQYIVKRDDGAIQPCKHSMLPFWAGLFGMVVLAIVAMVVFMIPPSLVKWPNLWVMTFIGFAAATTGLMLQFGTYRLMYAVGPKSYNGRRVLPFEEKQSA